MATNGSFSSSKVTATSKVWYWDFSWWVSSWSKNTATIKWECYSRCTTGTSGSQWVANYGFSGSIAGNDFSSSSNFYKDVLIASGSFTISGGSSFSANLTAHPYSKSNTSSGSQTWTLDNNVTTPTVTCSTTRGLNTIGAKMTVTNNGNASIVDHYIDLFTDSDCSNKVGTIYGASGTFTGLTPNTTYYVRANASNGTYRGYSSVKKVSTYNKATISSAPAITHGSSVTITYSNPSSSSLQIGIYKTDGSTALCSYRSCSGTSYTFSFTDIELDKMYKMFGTSNSISVRVYLKTAGSYTNYKTVTVTLTGNQKTARINISNSWKRAKTWININGTWKRGTLWININGTWHRCI